MVYNYQKYGNWPHKRYYEEGEDDNVIAFEPKIIRGSLDGSIPPTDNWLLALPVGSIFIAKDKMDRTNFALTRFEVVKTEPKNVFLFAFSRDLSEQQPFGEVDPTRFINRFDLVECVTDEPTE